MSLKNTYKEIEELQIWLKKNNTVLNHYQKQMVQKRVQIREFMFFKLKKNFFSTLMFFIGHKNIYAKLKNLFILLTPVFILKKIMWYQ